MCAPTGEAGSAPAVSRTRRSVCGGGKPPPYLPVWADEDIRPYERAPVGQGLCPCLGSALAWALPLPGL